jgi:SSS family solute:Na+ symporter
MFAGFILIFIFAFNHAGDFSFLSENLPENHLKITGGASPVFIVVWFLIALWTFADPGFHQRCYAAKDGNVAVKGIIISIFFWALFDFLTTVTGLYAKALLPGINQPFLSYPLLAEKILPEGIKGIFYSALFATIISTSNSFLFLSATTFGRDFIFRINKTKNENRLKTFTWFGLIIAGIISILFAYFIPSVIEIWYTIGSLCIPGIILPVVSSYYLKLKINDKIILTEMAAAVVISTTWFFIRDNFADSEFYQIEPMIAGLLSAVIIHLWGLYRKVLSSSEE